MHVFYTSKHLLHDEITPCYNSNQNCEKIDRVENILKTLQSYDQFTIISTTESSDLKPLPSTLTKDFGVEPILEIHSKELYNYLETAFEEWTKKGNVGGIIPSTYPHSRYTPQINSVPENISGKAGYFTFDVSSAIEKGTFKATYWASQCTLTAAQYLVHRMNANEKDGLSSFSLIRPPAHHSCSDLIGGFCYFNHTAIAAQWVLKHEKINKVAIVDIDYHHGNGTQSIFYDRQDVYYISLHAENEYPYFSGSSKENGINAGLGFNANINLSKTECSNDTYIDRLKDSLDNLLIPYSPDFLIISMGLDTYQNDPVGGFSNITSELYDRIGKTFKDFVSTSQKKKKRAVPCLFVLEGGYDLESLGDNVYRVLNGFEKN